MSTTHGEDPACPHCGRRVLAETKLAESQAREAVMREALHTANQFMSNGIELGYIRMPDKDCPDSAHETPRLVQNAISLPHDATALNEIKRREWSEVAEFSNNSGGRLLKRWIYAERDRRFGVTS